MERQNDGIDDVCHWEYLPQNWHGIQGVRTRVICMENDVRENFKGVKLRYDDFIYKIVSLLNSKRQPLFPVVNFQLFFPAYGILYYLHVEEKLGTRYFTTNAVKY